MLVGSRRTSAIQCCRRVRVQKKDARRRGSPAALFQAPKGMEMEIRRSRRGPMLAGKPAEAVPPQGKTRGTRPHPDLAGSCAGRQYRRCDGTSSRCAKIPTIPGPGRPATRGGRRLEYGPCCSTPAGAEPCRSRQGARYNRATPTPGRLSLRVDAMARRSGSNASPREEASKPYRTQRCGGPGPAADGAAVPPPEQVSHRDQNARP